MLRHQPIPQYENTRPPQNHSIRDTPFLNVFRDLRTLRTGLEPYPSRLWGGRVGGSGEEGAEDGEAEGGVDDY